SSRSFPIHFRELPQHFFEGKLIDLAHLKRHISICREHRSNTFVTIMYLRKLFNRRSRVNKTWLYTSRKRLTVTFFKEKFERDTDRMNNVYKFVLPKRRHRD
ncbi:MAG: hypothetical protein ACTS40_02215, partial [Candidatus Hodgkinia cicadicola]